MIMTKETVSIGEVIRADDVFDGARCAGAEPYLCERLIYASEWRQ